MELEMYKSILQKELSKERYVHSIGVMETSINLAKKYGASENKAAIAGLLHDCAKDIPEEEQLKLAIEFGILLDDISATEKVLIHGPLGAKIVEIKFGIKDKEILRAIEIHTTGDENMSLLDKIIYIADYIEPNRNFPGVEDIRETTFNDLDEGVLKGLNSTIRYVLEKNSLLHPKTVAARNSLLKNRRNKRGEL
ncbi:MAG: bis(5'-nucleosyl)-tetraphosphatase (symmetrical) YqeK [Thermovenabulum sp.]|uniref:bis(5'-nucleosyl)-tetraphosphatase (symmetrical) YqeK n=1 Tax=Thermovenabulum sp. TaxID=3100335 RepID=UPI003C7D277A